ncbi:acetolactate decarboxylase [Lactobacillus apis]|uniref:acetolactate decarboxylase n=1 Tax=Lactobacillus apis TaxID=303541 RepID=UPI000D6CEEE4|nr:acetolactate decarboxylase [Lactobacillus apis]AWM74151.1 acetolactate decarboxylase [Lactobacillus apis]
MANTLYQHGTMQMLVEGLLDGTMPIEDLLTHGSIGIGTGDGVDGELVILNGVGYKIDTSGKAVELPKDFKVTYADVCNDNYREFKQYQNVELEQMLNDVLDANNGQNQFFAILTKGIFQKIRTRSSKKSQKPYPSLGTIAQNQVEFETEDIAGTMITFYTPKVFQGVGVSGFHNHFLADNLSFGGHVLAATMKDVTVSIQPIENFDLHLPVNSQEYLQADLNDMSSLDNVISKSE